jgi:ABC-type phosphate transport system substrate-binding protein
MKTKYRLWGLLAMCMAAAFVTSGVAAGTAAAVPNSICMKVVAGEPSSWVKESVSTSACEGSEVSTGKWVLTVEGTGKTIEPGVLCIETKETKEAAYEDAECTKKSTTKAKYAKVADCGLGTAIKGQGSSLQKLAQEVWITNSKCLVTYESTGSGAGRKAWGIEEPANKPKTSGDAFIASDEPLNTKQISELDKATEAPNSGKEETIVIPVAQAAVAVIVNPPEKCEISEISNANLTKVWEAETVEWSNIATGTGCTGKIKRVVRKDVSGTTYVFKTYLNETSKEAKTCGGTGKTWKEYAKTENNLKWPECNGNGVTVAGNSGGAGEVEEVVNTTGAIGYANLADARKQYVAGKKYHWIKIRNESEAKSEEPGTSSTEPSEVTAEANCAGTHYTNLPVYGADDNWSEVNGAHPKGNKHYPICTLTYDIALSDYSHAGFEKAAEVGMSAMEYLEYVTSKNGGQLALAKHDYREVEEAVGSLAHEEAHLVNLKEL